MPKNWFEVRKNGMGGNKVVEITLIVVLVTMMMMVISQDVLKISGGVDLKEITEMEVMEVPEEIITGGIEEIMILTEEIMTGSE